MSDGARSTRYLEQMRAFHALSCAAIASLGCGSSTPETGGPGSAPDPVMTDLRLGGCAPIRYRELDPEADKPDEPPAPRVGVSFRVPSYLGPAFRTSVTRELDAIKPQLVACFSPSDIGARSQKRISLTFYMSRGGRVMRVRARGSGKARCVQDLVRKRIRQLTAPRNRTSAYMSLRFYTTKKPPEKEPDRIELVEGSDRVDTQLALAAAVADRRGDLERCLRAARLPAPGQLAASLRLDKGAVTSTEVNAGDRLTTCVAGALDDIDLGKPKLGGAFQCAASYGLEGTAEPGFATTVTARAIAVADAGPIDEALVREQRPPAGPLYRQLAERRFGPDGGEITALRLADDATGALVNRTTEATTAADVDIGAVELRRDGAWTPVARFSRIEAPRLSSKTGQAAGPVILVSSARLWAGAATSTLDVEYEIAAVEALGEHLTTMRERPGLAHRTDAVVGVGDEVTGALLGAVIEQVRGAGFDQLELISANAARARLAR